MATRVQEIRECDSGLCRRRKGVEQYKFIVKQGSNDSVLEQFQMELCPFHYSMVVRQIANKGENTKDYSEEKTEEVKYNG